MNDDEFDRDQFADADDVTLNGLLDAEADPICRAERRTLPSMLAAR